MNQTRSHNLVLLGWSAYFTGFSFFLLDIIIPMIGIAIDASPVEIGLYFSSLMVANIVSMPTAGLLVDRFGKKRVLVVGAFIRIVSFTVIGSAFILSSSALIILGRVFQGAAAGLFWTSLNALVADETMQSGRGKEMGVVNQWVYRGMVTGAILGMILLQWRIDLPLYLFAGASVASGLYALKIPSSNPLPHRPEESDRNNYASPLKIYITLCFVTLFLNVGYTIVGPFLTYYALQDLSSDFSLVGLAYLPSSIANSLLSARLGGLADKHGRARPLLVAALGFTFLTYGYVFIRSLWQLAVFTTLVGILSAAFSYAQNSLVGDITGRRRGSAYGFISMLAAGGGAVGAFVGGLLWNSGWQSLVIVSVLIQLIAVPFLLMLVSSVRNGRTSDLVVIASKTS